MPKNIVICCDGTGNQFGENPTNVLKLFQRVLKAPGRQVAFYDPGVGTSGSNMLVTYIGRKVAKLAGGALGYGITRNIEDAYRYLMDQFDEGDQVYIFGFSRGAFTARALAGMLCKVGLLHRARWNLVSFASHMNRQGDDKTAAGFKEVFSRPCDPHFVGVWDTVKSVGLFVWRGFETATLNPRIAHGYHALAIDERRSNFKPTLWDEPAAQNQTIEQVWFAGVHSDVGGYYDEAELSDIALRWMLRKAVVFGLELTKPGFAGEKDVHAEELHESLLWYWRIFGWGRRKIPAGANIHISVQKRLQEVKKYRPPNLPPGRKFVP